MKDIKHSKGGREKQIDGHTETEREQADREQEREGESERDTAREETHIIECRVLMHNLSYKLEFHRGNRTHRAASGRNTSLL